MQLIENKVNLPFLECVDLASEKVGGKVLFANDEFFAEKENLLKDGRGVFIPDKYTEFGKWMDGWETRRKRVPGYDYCLVRLGMPGVICGFTVDTNHFTGNFPEFCSLEATTCEDEKKLETATWTQLVCKSRLKGGSENFFAVDNLTRFTHVRFNIFPDGGVARLRVHGIVKPDWKKLSQVGEIDLGAIENGATVAACNDMFFGPKENLILPGRAKNMGEGWETRRRRGPGHDWIVVKLGTPGLLTKIEVDTNHFKGNFPDTCMIEAAFIEDDVSKDPEFLRRDHTWYEVLPRTKLTADTRHFFEGELKKINGKVNFVRLNIYPDGGISRLRLFGKPL